MNMENLDALIDKANDKFISGEVVGDEPVASETVDVYARGKKARYQESKKKRPNGCSVLVKSVTKSVLDGDGVRGAGLAPAHRRAKGDSELFRKRGENDRAELVRSQYMEDYFLPAVETIIAYTSPDELLNCKEALSSLDKFVLGVGRSVGYTAQYIRTAYANSLGEDYSNRIGESDDYVKRTVGRIKILANDGNNRDAVSLAISARKSIDNGEHMANDDDYALIGRVASFGM